MEMLGPLKVPTQPQLCRANVNNAIVEFLGRVAAIESCQKEHEWSQWWTSLLETVAHDRDVGAFLQGGGDCDPAEQSPKRRRLSSESSTADIKMQAGADLVQVPSNPMMTLEELNVAGPIAAPWNAVGLEVLELNLTQIT